MHPADPAWEAARLVRDGRALRRAFAFALVSWGASTVAFALWVAAATAGDGGGGTAAFDLPTAIRLALWTAPLTAAAVALTTAATLAIRIRWFDRGSVALIGWSGMVGAGCGAWIGGLAPVPHALWLATAVAGTTGGLAGWSALALTQRRSSRAGGG
jgi:hypothetical protein